MARPKRKIVGTVFVGYEHLAWEYTNIETCFLDEDDAKEWVRSQTAKLSKQQRESMHYGYKPIEVQ